MMTVLMKRDRNDDACVMMTTMTENDNSCYGIDEERSAIDDDWWNGKLFWYHY